MSRSYPVRSSAHSSQITLPPKPAEALIEFEFEFDIAEAAQEWASREIDSEKLVVRELEQEVRRIDLRLDQSPLQLPENSQEGVGESKAEDFLEDLKSRNPEFATLLEECPHLLWFFNQSTGYPLAFATEYGLRGLDTVMLQSWKQTVQADLPRQLNIQQETDSRSREEILVLKGCSRKTNLRYFEGADQENIVFMLCFDESELRIPKKFSGKAKISGRLLLSNVPQQSPEKFRSVVEKIKTARSHPYLNVALTNTQKTKLVQCRAASTVLIPPLRPKIWSLWATPLLTTGVLGGAACALFLLSVVAPPLGLGLIASALIAAGIGALMGFGIDVIRMRSHSKAVKHYVSQVDANQRTIATIFASSSSASGSSESPELRMLPEPPALEPFQIRGPSDPASGVPEWK
jgi:hypothetical protein